MLIVTLLAELVESYEKIATQQVDIKIISNPLIFVRQLDNFKYSQIKKGISTIVLFLTNTK